MTWTLHCLACGHSWHAFARGLGEGAREMCPACGAWLELVRPTLHGYPREAARPKGLPPLAPPAAEELLAELRVQDLEEPTDPERSNGTHTDGG